MKKRIVYPGGRVVEPFTVKDDGSGALWFYASRGHFDFLFQTITDGKWDKVRRLAIPTRMIRGALALVDSAPASRKPKAERKGAK